MALKTIQSKHWKLIVERIYEKFCGCVPFLGAAVNVGCPGYSGLPLGAELNRYLVEKLLDMPVASLGELAKVSPNKALDGYEDLLRFGLEDLARVALRYQFEMDAPSLINHLRTAIPDDERNPSKLLQVLARRRFELIVTTNYDRLMERALQEAKRPFLSVVQPLNGFQDAERLGLQQQLAAPEGVIVYKMHGTFLEQMPGSKARAKDIIVTEEQYLDFLTVVGHPHKGVPPLIAEKIQDSTLLFLGYSLEDWDFRALFKGLVEKLDESVRRKSFAIQKDPSSFWQQFWEDKKVIIYDMDLYEFAEELETRCLKYESENGLI